MATEKQRHEAVRQHANAHYSEGKWNIIADMNPDDFDILLEKARSIDAALRIAEDFQATL